MDVGVYFSRRAIEWREVVFNAISGVHEKVKVNYGGEIELPDEAFDVIRDQYSAPDLIKHVKSKKPLPAILIVGDDLYAPGMNFVFGQALAKEAAVLSTSRLKKDELIAKEIVHEFGHLIGLRHCKNRCVMEYSNSLPEAEDKPKEFCASCRETVDKVVA